MAQGPPHHRRHRLDGRHALSAAAVRLSRDGQARLEQSETFKVMERRLLNFINPAMIVTWLLGSVLAAARPVAGGRLAARQVRAGARDDGPARLICPLGERIPP